MPVESCIHKLIKFLRDEAKPYERACVAACLMNFTMFLLHFTMYNNIKEGDEGKEKEFKSN